MGSLQYWIQWKNYVQPQEAIVFEDSPNGIKVAKAANIFCVAVPNAITGKLDVNGADVVLESLGDMPLEQIIRLTQGEGTN